MGDHVCLNLPLSGLAVGRRRCVPMLTCGLDSRSHSVCRSVGKAPAVFLAPSPLENNRIGG